MERFIEIWTLADGVVHINATGRGGWLPKLRKQFQTLVPQTRLRITVGCWEGDAGRRRLVFDGHIAPGDEETQVRYVAAMLNRLQDRKI